MIYAQISPKVAHLDDTTIGPVAQRAFRTHPNPNRPRKNDERVNRARNSKRDGYTRSATASERAKATAMPRRQRQQADFRYTALSPARNAASIVGRGIFDGEFRSRFPRRKPSLSLSGRAMAGAFRGVCVCAVVSFPFFCFSVVGLVLFWFVPSDAFLSDARRPCESGLLAGSRRCAS